MIFLETKIESMYFYKDKNEFLQDLRSSISLDLIKKCRKILEKNENVRFELFDIEEIEDDHVKKGDDMKKFIYKTRLKFFNIKEVEKLLNNKDLKFVYKEIGRSHFHMTQRVYEIKDKMFTIGEK